MKVLRLGEAFLDKWLNNDSSSDVFQFCFSKVNAEINFGNVSHTALTLTRNQLRCKNVSPHKVTAVVA